MSDDLEARVKKLEAGGREVGLFLWALLVLLLFGFLDPSPILRCPPKYKWCQWAPVKAAQVAPATEEASGE